MLLVTNSERRVRNLREALTDVPGEADVWIAQDTKISKDTVLKGAVWLAHDGELCAVLRQGYRYRYRYRFSRLLPLPRPYPAASASAHS